MSIREWLYRRLSERFGPYQPSTASPSHGIGAISIGVRPVPADLLMAVLPPRDTIRRQVMHLLAPPTPKPDPVLITQQILERLEQHRRAQSEQLAAELANAQPPPPNNGSVRTPE